MNSRTYPFGWRKDLVDSLTFPLGDTFETFILFDAGTVMRKTMREEVKRSKAVCAVQTRRVPAWKKAAGQTSVRFSVPLQAETFASVAHHRDSAAALIESLGHALGLSRQFGKTFDFTVAIDPFGRAKITRVKPSAKPAVVGATNQAFEQMHPTEIFKQGDMLSAEQFAELIGASCVTVYERRRKNQVLGLDGAKRGFRFPTWQLDIDGKPFAALPALFEHLGGNGWSVYRFLLQQHPELDGSTGLEALRSNRTARVLQIAEGVSRSRM